MSVAIKDIKVGECYVTPSGQVRRVTKVTDDKIFYDSRGKKAKKGTWPTKGKAKPSTFADAVERKVSCDYDPNYPEK